MPWPPFQHGRWRASVNRNLNEIIERLDTLMSASDDIAAAATAITSAVTTLGTVTLHGEPLQADCAINMKGLCAVRADDGDWYLGDLVSDTGDIRCWGNYGPDLGHALRSL